MLLCVEWSEALSAKRAVASSQVLDGLWTLCTALHGEGSPEGEGWPWVEEPVHGSGSQLCRWLPQVQLYFSVSFFLSFTCKFFGCVSSLVLAWWTLADITALPHHLNMTHAVSRCSDLSPLCQGRITQRMHLLLLRHAMCGQPWPPLCWKWQQDNKKLILPVGV